MVTKTSKTFKANKINNKLNSSSLSKDDEKKLFAFLAILLSIFGFLIAFLVKRQDKYVMFYAKQSLVLFFAWIIANVIIWIFGLIPIIGGIVSGLMIAFMVVLWIIGMVYSLSGKEKEIPIIGELAEKINLD